MPLDVGTRRPNNGARCVPAADRKKDLVKLQAGEYVSLGRVETILSTSPFVDNLFVYGESSQNFVIAVVVANVKQLALLAREVLGAGAEGKSHEQLCKEERLEQEVQKRLVKQARHGEWLELSEN